MQESFKMEYKASVKIDPTSNPYLAHNDRTDNKAKNIYKEMSHENEYHIFNDNGESVKDMHDKLYQQAKETYMAKSKRKDKFTDKKATLVEAVYELTPDTSKEQVIKLTQEIAKLTGFTPLHIAIHKDEGHTTENNTFQKHYHAHAIFFTLDKDTGKQLKRQKAALTKDNLSKMQDLATEYLSTDNYKMVRGEKRHEHNKKVRARGGDKSEYKNKVYEKSIKVYAKNQAIEQREKNVFMRELVQNQKDYEGAEILKKVDKRINQNKKLGWFDKKTDEEQALENFYKTFTPQQQRLIAYEIIQAQNESIAEQENQEIKILKNIINEKVEIISNQEDKINQLEKNIYLKQEQKNKNAEVAKEKVKEYLKQRKQNELTPTFAEKLKNKDKNEWDR